MATQRLDIILNAQGQAEAILQRTNRELRKVGKEVKEVTNRTAKSAGINAKFGLSMRRLGGSISKATAPLDRLLSSLGGLKGALKIGLLIAAAKKMVDFAEGGAVLEAQLARLGGPIKSTMARLEELQEASGNVFSLQALAKAEIMQKELGVQLNFTGKELEKLDARFTAMGMDGKQSLEQVITSLARSRKSFLQVLGLVRDLEGAYQRYGEAQGVARRDLTEIQKREALIMEVKANIQKIDLEAGRSVAAFEQMRAAVADAFTYIKLAMAPIGKLLVPIARAVRDVAKAFAEALAPAVRAIAKVLGPVLDMLAALAGLLAKLLKPLEWFGNILDVVTGDINHFSTSLQRLNDRLQIYIDLNRQAAKEVKNLTVEQLVSARESIKSAKILVRMETARRINRIAEKGYYRGQAEDIDKIRDVEKKRNDELDAQLNTIQGRLKTIREEMAPKWEIQRQKQRLKALLEELAILEKGSNLSAEKIERAQELRTFTIPELQTSIGLFNVEQRRVKALSALGKQHQANSAAYLKHAAVVNETARIEAESVQKRAAQFAADEAKRKRTPTARRPAAAKLPGPPPDRTKFYELELAILLAKERHLDVEMLSVEEQLKYLHLTEQIKRESEGSQEAAINLHKARTNIAKRAFDREKQRRMDEVKFEMAMLTVHDDAIAQFKEREVALRLEFAATSKSAEGIEMRNKAELEYAHALAELQRTKSQYLKEEYDEKVRILDKTRQLTREEAKRVDFAKHWGDMSATFSSTGSAMSGVNKEMGVLANAMGQGAQITANHVKENQSWQQSTQQGMAVGQAAAMQFVEDTEKQAAISALFEVAKGFVALATPNMGWAAAFHFAAAAAFGAIAGGAFGGEKAKKKPARRRDRGGGEGGSQIIVNMAAGVILGRPQDIGRAIGQATGAISKTGMGTSAV